MSAFRVYTHFRRERPQPVRINVVIPAPTAVRGPVFVNPTPVVMNINQITANNIVGNVGNARPSSLKMRSRIVNPRIVTADPGMTIDPDASLITDPYTCDNLVRQVEFEVTLTGGHVALPNIILDHDRINVINRGQKTQTRYIVVIPAQTLPAGPFGGICRSRDGGTTWESLDEEYNKAFTTSAISRYPAAVLAVSPHTGRLFAGTQNQVPVVTSSFATFLDNDGFFYSDDEGKTFATSTTRVFLTGDPPLSDALLQAAGAGGPTPGFIAFHPTDPTVAVFGQFQVNLYRSTTIGESVPKLVSQFGQLSNGRTMTECRAGAFFASTNTVVVGGVGPAVAGGGSPIARHGSIWQSTDGGQIYTQGYESADVGSVEHRVRDLDTRPSSSTEGLAAETGNNGIVRTTNAGSSWSASNTGLVSSLVGGETIYNVFAVKYAPSDGTRAYCIADDPVNSELGLYSSDDAGVTWTKRFGVKWLDNDNNQIAFDSLFSDGSTSSSMQLFGLSVHPTDKDDVLFAFPLVNVNTSVVDQGPAAIGVYRSTNGGPNAAQSNTGMAFKSKCAKIVHDPTNPGLVYASCLLQTKVESPTSFNVASKEVLRREDEIVVRVPNIGTVGADIKARTDTPGAEIIINRIMITRQGTRVREFVGIAAVDSIEGLTVSDDNAIVINCREISITEPSFNTQTIVIPDGVVIGISTVDGDSQATLAGNHLEYRLFDTVTIQGTTFEVLAIEHDMTFNGRLTILSGASKAFINSPTSQAADLIVGSFRGPIFSGKK